MLWSVVFDSNSLLITINMVWKKCCTCQQIACHLLVRMISWWRHQMETFSALLAICAGNSPVAGEFPAQRPVTRSFDVFFDPRLNKRLSKQSWGWWFEALSRPLWRHRNVHHDLRLIWMSPNRVVCTVLYSYRWLSKHFWIDILYVAIAAS